MSGSRLLGIARQCASRPPIKAVSEVPVTLGHSVTADLRCRARPGRGARRQLSIVRVEDWPLSRPGQCQAPPRSTRRENLLVDGLRLPRRAGTILGIGGDVGLEIAGERDPCRPMGEQHQGLMAALLPDWRGGVLARAVHGGDIAIGDEVRI